MFALFRVDQNPPQETTLNALVTNINEGKVEKLEVKNDEMVVKLKDADETFKTKKEEDSSVTETLVNLGVNQEKFNEVEITIEGRSGLGYWAATLLPFAIPVVILFVIIFYATKTIQKGNSKAMMFGKSPAKKVDPNAKNKVTFKDIAGIEEAKEELNEVVEFLKHPKKFKELGAEIPKGVLLVGPPGTGKTLLARAVAGQADVPFFHIAGSEFVEMFVGVGASRVRDLFNKAKKSAPAILFIDEIDAVGRQRGAGLGGSHDEREQTLNQILTEMDGFEQDTHVILIAATNRPDVLDPALLRPGRFDRRVTIGFPDIKDRISILKIHAKGKPLAKEVDFKKLAQRTPGFSGADLKNLLNEAAILAARDDKKSISLKNCFDAIEKVMLGPERKSFLLSKKEKKIAAFHEAGHALVAHEQPHTDPVQKISIVSRGQAAGFTLKTPEADKHFHTKQEFEEELSVMLAGLAAEKVVFNETTTGASSDLRSATGLARRLVTEYGMNENLGPMTFGDKEELIFLGKEIGEQRNYSEKTAAEIDVEIRSLVKKAYSDAEAILRKNQETLTTLADELIDKETIEKDEFEEIVGKKRPIKPSIEK